MVSLVELTSFTCKNWLMNVGSMIGNNVFIGLGATAEGEIKPKSKIL